MERLLRLLPISLVLATPCLLAQFNSGSTGSDLALNLTTPGTYDFDPAALSLNPAKDNVFNFTTINIAAGVTLRLRASKVRNAAVVWLASGDVTIAGTLDLSGSMGAAWNGSRVPAEPGPGGYAGGVGGSISSPPTAGAGPGGGAAPAHGCAGAYGVSFVVPQNGCNSLAYGNPLLVPLRGGSGGGGGVANANNGGSGGGAGGGALEIASSGTITVSGSILAVGGNGGVSVTYCGGPGSGGGIHLQAQTITGAGSINASGGLSCSAGYSVGDGRIRIDANTNSFTGTVTPAPTSGAPFNTPLPTTAPTVHLVNVNGVAVPPAPLGSFTAPDVTINSNTAVNIAIAASNVPLGTVVKLYLASETGADQVISCAPLAGSVASSTASCSAVFPLGTTVTLARAVW